MAQQERDRSNPKQAAGSALAEPPPPRVEAIPPRPAPLARQPLARHPWGRVLVNAFILWHLFALTIWVLPQSALRQEWAARVAPYMTLTGFMQGWTMFSPNPANVDLYFEARITYADGRVRGWNFPRMVRLGYLDRYQQERWRKLVEIANSDANQMVWPSLARYAARRSNLYPGNPPVSVALVRHYRYIPPPGLLFAPFQTYVFFTRAISAQDLR